METQAAQVKAEDFGIIAELHEVLAERDVMLDSNQIRFDAEEALTPVQNGVRPLGPGDPLTYANSALDRGPCPIVGYESTSAEGSMSDHRIWECRRTGC